jgi:hypothetical protein
LSFFISLLHHNNRTQSQFFIPPPPTAHPPLPSHSPSSQPVVLCSAPPHPYSRLHRIPTRASSAAHSGSTAATRLSAVGARGDGDELPTAATWRRQGRVRPPASLPFGDNEHAGHRQLHGDGEATRLEEDPTLLSSVTGGPSSSSWRSWRSRYVIASRCLE